MKPVFTPPSLGVHGLGNVDCVTELRGVSGGSGGERGNALVLRVEDEHDGVARHSVDVVGRERQVVQADVDRVHGLRSSEAGKGREDGSGGEEHGW
jgi:hypothetical protein